MWQDEQGSQPGHRGASCPDPPAQGSPPPPHTNPSGHLRELSQAPGWGHIPPSQARFLWEGHVDLSPQANTELEGKPGLQEGPHFMLPINLI